jgi:integrase
VRLADGGKFGDLPIAELRLEHCERVMSALPRELSRSSRRHTGQVMHRVLGLAVYPLRLIVANPLPRGFLPKQGSTRAKSYLFPDEDRQLLSCVDVPLDHRMLYGFLAREGMRKSEALRLTWRDLNLARGMVRLDSNKTDEPRAWALSLDVVRALQLWRVMRPETTLVFDVSQPARLALAFRKHLQLAHVHRTELFEKTKLRLPIRLHDLRATFVTVHLAHGKSETWIADRTGHKSSQMINTYRRQARTWVELGIDALAPLDAAVPELATFAARRGDARRAALA